MCPNIAIKLKMNAIVTNNVYRKIEALFIIILEVLAFYLQDSNRIYGPKTDSSLSLEIYTQILSSQILIRFL